MCGMNYSISLYACFYVIYFYSRKSYSYKNLIINYPNTPYTFITAKVKFSSMIVVLVLRCSCTCLLHCRLLLEQFACCYQYKIQQRIIRFYLWLVMKAIPSSYTNTYTLEMVFQELMSGLYLLVLQVKGVCEFITGTEFHVFDI